jgi:recombination protein RecR
VSSFAPPVQRLVTELSRLPGIGSRTAQRLAFHILRASSEDALGLAEAIKEVKEKVGLCEVCFNLADEPRCRICQDARRDAGLICVVEEPSDVIPMERTHEFHGLYHVLGGALSPIDGIEPEDLKIDELYARIAPGEEGVGGDGMSGAGEDGAGVGEAGVGEAEGDALAESSPTRARGTAAFGEAGPPAVREVVLATNPTTTGEATALHIAEELRGRAPHLTITRLASGLPVGSDLEYADEVTLGKALAGRRSL